MVSVQSTITLDRTQLDHLLSLALYCGTSSLLFVSLLPSPKVCASRKASPALRYTQWFCKLGPTSHGRLIEPNHYQFYKFEIGQRKIKQCPPTPVGIKRSRSKFYFQIHWKTKHQHLSSHLYPRVPTISVQKPCSALSNFKNTPSSPYTTHDSAYTACQRTFHPEHFLSGTKIITATSQGCYSTKKYVQDTLSLVHSEESISKLKN